MNFNILEGCEFDSWLGISFVYCVKALSITGLMLLSLGKIISTFYHQTQGPAVPPLPPGGLRGDDDDDEDTYEEAEPYVANTTLSNTGA